MGQKPKHGGDAMARQHLPVRYYFEAAHAKGPEIAVVATHRDDLSPGSGRFLLEVGIFFGGRGKMACRDDVGGNAVWALAVANAGSISVDGAPRVAD